MRALPLWCEWARAFAEWGGGCSYDSRNGICRLKRLLNSCGDPTEVGAYRFEMVPTCINSILLWDLGTEK